MASSRQGDMPRFERIVLLGSIGVVTPSLIGLALVAWFDHARLPWLPLLLLVVVGATVLLLHWQRRRVTFPIYTLTGLIGALREADYSLRGVPGGVLSDIVSDVNALADRLQRERLRFEESSYLLGKTLAALDSAVFVFDGQRRLQLANPMGQQLLGSTDQSLFDRDADELGVSALLDGPARQVLTHAFIGRTGRFEIRHAPMRSDGRGGQLLVVNDLGRLLRDEERQAWQRLLRVISHEVNNSLAPIKSMAGTLATLATREPLPEDWRDDFRSGLDLIGHRAGALARFLSSYGQLARLPPPQRRRVDLAELVAKVARLEQHLPVVIIPGESLVVDADADQLEQALINLMRNGVEASPTEHGRVTARWYRDGERVVIEVEDNGPGPPASDNLFVPFFTTKPGGSGIGLALVRQIAEAHDGGASLLARDDGSGARAQLWLPLATSTTQPRATE